MKRTMMQVYVKGSDEAVPFYQRAFDAELISSYQNGDGTYYHSELAFEGQVLAVAERNSAYAIGGEEAVTGNVMQFCLDYGEGGEERVTRAYDTLREGATLLIPLGPCEYSPLMADLIDRYGVRWCLFV